MTATAHVALVVDNTGTQKQRSKRNTPSQSFLTDQHPIYGGKAEVVRTQQSGGYWHFRMWISEERKYVRKTLKTTHLDTAIQRAENEFFAIKANVNAGKRIFSPTVQQAAEEYLKHRWDVDVKRGSITEGRWGTIKSQLNHFVAYCGIVGREANSSVTRLSDLESKSLQGYQQYRQKRNAKDVTIKNEQSSINALCKWAFEEGLHLAPVVRYSGPQEAFALLTGQIFAFPIDSEQFISHLFTLAHLIHQEKDLNPVIGGGEQGRR